VELARRRGELLERDQVEITWTDALRRLQSRFLSVVSRIRQRLPHLTAHEAQIIDEEIRAALTASSEVATGDG